MRRGHCFPSSRPAAAARLATPCEDALAPVAALPPRGHLQRAGDRRPAGSGHVTGQSPANAARPGALPGMPLHRPRAEPRGVDRPGRRRRPPSPLAASRLARAPLGHRGGAAALTGDPAFRGARGHRSAAARPRSMPSCRRVDDAHLDPGGVGAGPAGQRLPEPGRVASPSVRAAEGSDRKETGLLRQQHTPRDAPNPPARTPASDGTRPRPGTRSESVFRRQAPAAVEASRLRRRRRRGPPNIRGARVLPGPPTSPAARRPHRVASSGPTRLEGQDVLCGDARPSVASALRSAAVGFVLGLQLPGAFGAVDATRAAAQR